MSQHERFHLRSLGQLQAEIARLGVDIPVSETVTALTAPLPLAGGRLSLANRVIIQPMEGFDADPNGVPGPLAFRRYRRYAEGGAALIWFEATAVVPEARSNPGQFWLHAGSVATFTRLVAETRTAARRQFGREPVLVLQLTHSGRYSKPSGVPQPMIAHHSAVLDPLHRLPADYPLVTDAYLDQLQDAFVATARLAAQAGFDGVDVKCCHRYLLSELLASHTREGKYGGAFENRTRMLRETLGRIRAAVPELFVTTRLNAFDAIEHPYGWGVSRTDGRVPDLAEPLRLIGELAQAGLPLLNISIGNPYYQAHYGRPFDFPVQKVQLPVEHPLEGIARFLQITRTVQEAQPGLPIVGSGYSWLRQFLPQVAAAVLERRWATLIGLGREAFAYPDAVKDLMEKGALDPDKCCVACSACTQIMRDGGKTGCVVRDSAVYGPQYRLARRFALDRLTEEARQCRDCEQATCSRGCPAQIDIPAFLKAFANGDMAKAYAVLKVANVLPEVCGSICPAAEQCQGHCVENIFCQRPMPIQDIQLLVARTARLRGLTGVQLPEKASGRRVAIVGGGPAGIACAIRLLELGHQVELFDKRPQMGGTPDHTIPEERFGDSLAEVEAILKPAVAAGRLGLHLGQALGKGLTLAGLRESFDAVFLGFGLSSSTSIGEAAGVFGALEFLAAAKSGQLKIVPDRVAVLGGGNTAMDAALTALRLGARDVYVVYRRSFAEMPAWAKERDELLAAGGHLLLLTQPLGYVTDGQGQVCGVRICRTELGAPDASGRRAPVAVPGSESVLQVGMAIEAIGQGIDPAAKAALTGLAYSRGGLVAVAKGSHATNLPGVLAGGDLTNGGQTAVQAIVDGMQAAAEIDRQFAVPRG